MIEVKLKNTYITIHCDEITCYINQVTGKMLVRLYHTDDKPYNHICRLFPIDIDEIKIREPGFFAVFSNNNP